MGIVLPRESKYEFQLYGNEMYLSRITMVAKKIALGGPQWQQPKQQS